MKNLPLLIASILIPSLASADVNDFSDLVIWAGSGANEAALIVDWNDGRSPLAWGYRWDGTASGEDMLRAIVAADSQFYASLGTDFPTIGPFVSGLGYDRDDGGFGVAGGTLPTPFDANGIYEGLQSNNATSSDAGDSYAETNEAPGATGFGDFWEYLLGTDGLGGAGNPYAGGVWESSGFGIRDRVLSNGDWDGFFHPGFITLVPGVAQAAGATPVPEPSGAIVFAVLLGVACCRRR